MKEETIPKKEAMQQLKNMITRTALLHYAFTQTLIEELGEKKGKALALKAIKRYGGFVGQKARKRAEEKGLPFTRENFQDDLPSLGWHYREKVGRRWRESGKSPYLLLSRHLEGFGVSRNRASLLFRGSGEIRNLQSGPGMCSHQERS